MKRYNAGGKYKQRFEGKGVLHMPNICEFLMRVKGTSENVDTFVEILQDKNCDNSKRFCRVFEAELCYEEVKPDETKVVEIAGNCAWSVHTCMCDGAGSYYEDATGGDATTLKEQSLFLNIDIEVYSKEPGIGFQEHYLYKHGEEIENECRDYYEFYFDDEDEFNKRKEDSDYVEYLQGKKWDDVADGGSLEVGGFTEWDFQI